MEAQTYYESLTAQGYSSDQAQQYTTQHYPGFTAAAPVMAEPQMQAAPTQMMVGDVSGMEQPMQPMSAPAPGGKKGWRIANGIFGLIFSLMMLGYSFWIKTMVDEVGKELEKEIENSNAIEQAIAADLIDQTRDLISTLSTLYTVLTLLAVVMLVMSILQFLNKPWGAKALLGSVGLFLVVLLATSAYEYSAFNDLIDEVNEWEFDEDEKAENIPIGMTPASFGAYCALPCFFMFSLFAFLGRSKGEPVTMSPMMP